MDCSNNNHDHCHGIHDDEYYNYKLFPLLTDDQSSQNSPVFEYHHLPHAVIPSTYHDQAPRNSEVANVDDETTVDEKVAKVKTSSVKKRKREDAEPALPEHRDNKAPKDNKAINFPISSLQIGSWKRRANHNEELLARCYFSKDKLAWEVLDEKNGKNKLEFYFSDIDAINSVITPQKGLLYIRLKNRPTFSHDVNQEPKKHAKWKDCVDFTDKQEATRTRVHKLEIAPRDLQKHYRSIIEYDNKLLELSKRKFPEKESPLFDGVQRDHPYINSMNNPSCTLPEHPSKLRVQPQLSFPPQGYGFNSINAIQHIESGRNWAECNMSQKYANHNYSTRNYSIDAYPGEVYDKSNNNRHLRSAIPQVVPPMNINPHGRPQEWSSLQVYPEFGTTTPAALIDKNVFVPTVAHARLNDFSSNTSIDDLMQRHLNRYLQQHGSSYNDKQLKDEASTNHDIAGHVANQRRSSNNNNNNNNNNY